MLSIHKLVKYWAQLTRLIKADRKSSFTNGLPKTDHLGGHVPIVVPACPLRSGEEEEALHKAVPGERRGLHKAEPKRKKPSP